MKRDELKKIEGLTEEQIEAIMKIHGNDATAWNQKVKALEDKAKAFEGVNVEDLKKQVADLTAEKAEIVYDNTLTRAIEKAGGRSVKAIRALLDEKTLKDSKDLEADLAAAIEKVKGESSWAFETVSKTEAEKEGEKEAEKTATRVSTGGEHGTGGDSEDDAVTAAFKALNPGLKL